jgi:hypothetical protein
MGFLYLVSSTMQLVISVPWWTHEAVKMGCKGVGNHERQPYKLSLEFDDLGHGKAVVMRGLNTCCNCNLVMVNL